MARITLTAIALTNSPAPPGNNASGIKASAVVSVDPKMDIRYCARLFENLGLGRAPVLDGGRVVGIVGYTDIVLHGIRDQLLS